MSEYKQVKIGKLKLKGSSSSRIKKKAKKRKHVNQSEENSLVEDTKQNNGWWIVSTPEHLMNCTTCVVETYLNRSLLFAVDNGTLKLGNSHNEEDAMQPMDEEIFTMIRITETKVALKTGFGKYVSVNARGDVYARLEAVGPQEQLEIVIEDGKTALQGHNGYFITINDESELKAISRTAQAKEIFKIWTNTSKKEKKKKDSEEDVGNVRQFEINYVKQFQSFKDHKLRIHEGPASSLEKAKTKGKLHEAMLDRREKMKADRYCK